MRFSGRALALGAVAFAATFAGLVASRPIGDLTEITPFLLLVVPALFAAAARWARMSGDARAAVTGAALALAVFQVLWTARLMVLLAAHPPEWDFAGFWLAGRVASTGVDFYDPESFRRLAIPMGISEGFRSEIVKVGFWYPAPTMLFLLPFGVLEFATAAKLWYALSGCALLGSIVLAWRAFFREMGATGLAVSAALLCLLPGTENTIRYAQTHALVVLALLLCWRDRDRARGGVWLVLAALVKPIAACMIAWVVLRRRWRLLAGTLAASAVVVAVSAWAFGPGMLVRYFAGGPLSRLPAYVYTQTVNASLPAAVLRALGPDSAATIGHPLVIAVPVALAAGTLAWLWRAGTGDGVTFAAVAALGLLVYPATLVHYSMIAILPICTLWASRGSGRAGAVIVAATAGVVYAAGSWGEAGALPAHVVLWGVAMARTLRRRPDATAVGHAV